MYLLNVSKTFLFMEITVKITYFVNIFKYNFFIM